MWGVQAEEGLQRTQQAVQQASYEQPDEERIKRAQQDPEIQQLLADPMVQPPYLVMVHSPYLVVQVQQAIRDFKDNPKYAQQALKEPQMAAKLSKLAAAGILRFQ